MDTFDEVLAEALKVTLAAHLPPHLEAIAFEKAIDAFSGRVRTPPNAGRGRQSPSHDSDAQDGPLERIAGNVNIDLSLVEEVFSLDSENGIQLIIGPGKIESEKRAGARQVATLVAGSRQLGGIEDWTEARRIREVCQHYGKFDSANFASTLTHMDDIFGFKGKGQSREVRINKPGCEAFKALLLALTGDLR